MLQNVIGFRGVKGFVLGGCEWKAVQAAAAGGGASLCFTIKQTHTPTRSH